MSKKAILYYNKTATYKLEGESYEEGTSQKAKDIYEVGYITPMNLFQVIKQFNSLDDLKKEYKDYKLEEYKIPKDESNSEKI